MESEVEEFQPSVSDTYGYKPKFSKRNYICTVYKINQEFNTNQPLGGCHGESLQPIVTYFHRFRHHRFRFKILVHNSVGRFFPPRFALLEPFLLKLSHCCLEAIYIPTLESGTFEWNGDDGPEPHPKSSLGSMFHVLFPQIVDAGNGSQCKVVTFAALVWKNASGMELQLIQVKYDGRVNISIIWSYQFSESRCIDAQSINQIYHTPQRFLINANYVVFMKQMSTVDGGCEDPHCTEGPDCTEIKDGLTLIVIPLASPQDSFYNHYGMNHKYF